MPEQPAVPAFANDPEVALAEVGRMYLYIKQLSDTLKERAVEANQLDSALDAAQDELNESIDTIGQLREEAEALSRDVFDLRARSLALEDENENLRGQLADAKDEMRAHLHV